MGATTSLTYPQVPVGCKLDAEARRVRLHGVGLVKIILHRPLEGTPKTATISRSSTGKWYVCFSCECAEPALPLPATGQQVGIDVGLKTFATLSDGQEIANPRFFRAEENALAKVQRRLSKVEKGTPERLGAVVSWRACMNASPGDAATLRISTAVASSTSLT